VTAGLFVYAYFSMRWYNHHGRCSKERKICGGLYR
jgi:hypothetical protein